MHLVREVKKEDATNTAKLPHKQKLLLNKVTTTCFGGHSVFAGGKVGIVQFNDSFTGCLGVFFLDTEIFEVIKNVDVVTFNKLVFFLLLSYSVLIQYQCLWHYLQCQL